MTICICPDAGKDGHRMNCPHPRGILAQVRQEAREDAIREQNMLADEYDMLPVVEHVEPRWRHPVLWWFIGVMSCLAFMEWVI